MSKVTKQIIAEELMGRFAEDEEELDIHLLGETLIGEMSEEERSIIRRDCHTLHFVKLLKLGNQRADRMVAGNESRVSYKPVGIVLRTDIDLHVPDIPGEYDKDTGIPAEVVGQRFIKAGSEFALTYYEFMFLMLRPEYAGFCTRDSDIDGEHDPFGVYFSAKMPKYIDNESPLPTPTINFRLAGSPKETMDSINFYNEDTQQWEVKPEYEWKFSSYNPTVTLTRKPANTDNFPTSTNAAIGLAAELRRKYNYKIK